MANSSSADESDNQQQSSNKQHQQKYDDDDDDSQYRNGNGKYDSYEDDSNDDDDVEDDDDDDDQNMNDDSQDFTNDNDTNTNDDTQEMKSEPEMNSSFESSSSNHNSKKSINNSNSNNNNHSIYKEDSDDEDDDNYNNKSKKKKKRKHNQSDDDDDDDYKPDKKSSKTKKSKTSKIKREYSDDDDDDFRNDMDDDDDDNDSDYGSSVKKKSPKKSKTKHDNDSKVKKSSKTKSSSKDSKSSKSSKKIKKEESDELMDTGGDDKKPETKKRKKKQQQEEEDAHIWKWWEEESPGEGIKWKTLEHNGPVFPPDYERLPKNVKFYYDGKHVELSSEAEEVAGFYARMLDHDYTSKEIFNKNFFKDWRKTMTEKERELITDLKKCNFKEMHEYFKQQSELRKQMTKEEKQEIKRKNEEIVNRYGYCIVDGHKQKIGNFRIEPPGLFRGRGEHPKMGKLKKRVRPEDITINIGESVKVPSPPPGRKWKEVRHDNTVTWLASWVENIMGNVKYIMLNPSSKLKSIKDWQKYEKARELKKYVNKIRSDYRNDFKSREMMKRQRAVALYFIDKLALRAGNEKEEGETADTVGCCSLRVEHITLHQEKDGQQYVVDFDFLGKDSIRYVNSVSVEKRVFKNLKHFIVDKSPGDDLFDRLNTSSLNKYLNSLMDGLTAKVFRTYNASNTLQQQLNELTKSEMTLPEKLLAYNRANRAVALLCNHQKSVSKTHDKQMENLNAKIKDKKQQIKELKKQYKDNKSDKEKYEKKLKTLKEQLKKLEVARVDKEENKQIALGTSKLNYLDPRISVAWCKKWNVPIEKIYNKTQRDKFRWAIEMVGPEYQF